jgi:hypothetical protein
VDDGVASAWSADPVLAPPLPEAEFEDDRWRAEQDAARAAARFRFLQPAATEWRPAPSEGTLPPYSPEPPWRWYWLCSVWPPALRGRTGAR